VEDVMKKQKEKKRKEIVVIDKGIDTDAVGHGVTVCCYGAFAPFR
jgi:hypothetical protein